MKFTLNRKSLMKFGKWSLALFSLTLLGFFIFTYIIPALADTPTGTGHLNVTLNVPADEGYNNTANVNFTFTPEWNTSGIIDVANCSLMGNFSADTWTNYSWNASPIVNNVINGINYTFSSDGTYIWNIYCWNLTVGVGANATDNRTVIVDTTDPVLNTTHPGDNKYISGNDSQLFEVYIYDDNLNTSNVTLFYQLNGAGAWTGSAGNMNCVAGSVSTEFVCNTTVDNLYDNYGEGAQINYYFEAFDNATNAANNGTTSSYNYVTIDRTAPTDANAGTKIASSAGYWNPDENYGFQIDWTDSASGVMNVTFEANFTGALTNYTMASTPAITKTSNTYYINFTQDQLANATVGYGYRWYANDSVVSLNTHSVEESSNWVKTSITAYTLNKNASTSDWMNLTLGNATSTAEANNTVMFPQIVNATAWNDSSVFGGQVIEFVLYRNDTLVGTGGIINESVRWGGGTAVNYTYNTSGNANYSAASKEFWAITVQNDTNPVDVYLNGTANTNRTVVYPAQVNVTYLFLYNSSTDNTGTPKIWRISGGTETDVTDDNLQNVALANGTYDFKVNITGNVNYTDNATGVTFNAEVWKGATSINLYINGTEANLTIAKGSVVNTSVLADNSEGTLWLYVNNAVYNETTGVSLIHENNMTTFSGVPGTEYNITGYYNGSDNYTASSPTEYYVKIEQVAPTYSNLGIVIGSGVGHNTTNNSIIGQNSGDFNISAQWTDGFTLDNYWLLNGTTNTTEASFTTGNWTNITIYPSAYSVGTILNLTIYVNDTSGNENSTTTYRYTIDGTAPSLSNPIPANESYITRNSSYPFYITITDYTLNTSNVTFYYKKSDAGSWKNFGMSCSESIPTYTCVNDSIDLNVYADGDVIYYYYEASDNSSLMGTNGTASTPNVVTLDITSPQYSLNNTNVTLTGKYDTVLIYTYWTDADTLDTTTLETNETGTIENKTIAQHALVTTFTGSSAWSNFTWSNSSVDVGTVVQWSIYANDTVGNENVTANGTFTIDGTVPTYSGQTQNVTNGTIIVKGMVLNLTVIWNDNLRLDKYWASRYNSTGNSWENDTVTDMTSDNQTDLVVDTSSFASGDNIKFKIFANDSSGNDNVTAEWNYTVDSTAPTYGNKSDSISGEAMYAPGASYYVNISWADDLQVGNISTVLLNFSSLSTNQTATSLGSGNYSGTLTDLAVGNYTYKWYAKDTSNNWNETIVYTLNITQNTTTSSWMNLTLGNTTTVAEANNTAMYPQANNATGYYDSNVLSGQTMTFTLYKNDTTVGVTVVGTNTSVSDTTQYAGRTEYKYVYNTSGNTNYSTASKEFWASIVQNDTNPIDVYIQNSTQAYKNQDVTESALIQITVNATAVYGNETELKLFSNVSGADAQVSNPYTSSSLTAALYYFKTNITETTNYTSNTSASLVYNLTITEDTTGPTVLLYDYTNGTVRKSTASLTLNISVSDNTGVNDGDTCNVTIDGTTDRTITHLSGWCNGTITVPAVSSDGNYTINITVNDNSTNTNEGFNDSYVLTVDNTTPVITITFPSNDTYNKSANGHTWINATVYDLIKMGLDNVTVSGTNASTFEVYNFTGVNNTALSVYNNTTLSDGFVELTFTYTDNATNSISAAVQFYVDNTPTTSFTALTTGTKANSSTQEVNVTVNDGSTGMTNSTITLHYKRGSLIDWTTATMTGTPSTSTTYGVTIDTSMLADGEHVYYYVTGSDNATNPFSTNNGSASNPLAYFTIGDVTLPANPAEVNVAQIGLTREINVSWNASISSDVITYNVYRKLNGVVTTSDYTSVLYVGNVNYASIAVGSDGNWNFTVTAVDSSANENTTIVAAANITIDTTAPSVTNSNTAPVKDSNGKISDSTPTIVVNISETGTCRFDTVDVAMSSMTYEMTGSGTQNHNYTITTALNDSTHTYYIRCNDTAGNTMTLSATLSFILDTTGNFNYTQDLTGSTSGTWDTLWIPSQSVMEAIGYTATATNDWNISYVLTTTGGLGTNYNLVYYYNGSAWASFNKGSWDASSLQYMNNTNDDPYWINMTVTDRFEI